MNNRIKQVRKEAGLTMEKFGEQIGVTKALISMLESGKQELSTQTLKAICREFNVNEEWLKTGEGEMHTQLGEHEIIMQRLAKVQRATGDEKAFAQFKERLASAILNMDDSGCEAMLKVLADMGYSEDDDESQLQ